MATALSYPTISGVTGAPYLSALTDTANIQDTINYLYYGSTKAVDATNGIYGMLTKLQTQITGLQTGINVHESAKWATATTLAAVYAAGTADASGGTGISATITFSATGVQKIDSTTTDIALNDRILVKNGTTALSGTTSVANGIYYVSTLPAIGVAGILTRALDSDNSVAGEMSEGDFLYVTDGDSNANEAFMLTTSSATGTNPSGGQGAIRIGTDPVTFTQFIGVGSYYLGTTAVQITSANQALTGISSMAMASGAGGTFTLTPASSASSFAITIPAAADTLIGKATTDTLTNKSLSDSTTWIVDAVDNTKRVNIDVTGTTGITGVLQTAFTTAKTIAFPDTAGTVYVSSGTDVTLTDGGTNASLTASNGGIVWSNATQLQILAGTATAGKLLRSGASVTPAWSTATFPDTATTAGAILRADGTNWAATSATYPATVATTGTILRASAANTWTATTSTFADTYAVNTLLYASSANTVTGLALGTANQVLTVNAGGTAFTWATPSSGSLGYLGTTQTTASSAGTSTLAGVNTFTPSATASIQPSSVATTPGIGVSLIAGATSLSTGSPNGGSVTITGGAQTNATPIGTGGAVTITAGAGGANGVGGSLALAAGAGGANGGGSVTILAGFSAAGNGTISIGTSNTDAITIGATGKTTTIAGTVIKSGDGVILKTASFTVGAGETNYNVTGVASVTVTLPTATTGRTINIVNKAAFTIVSASSNVMPRTGTQTLGTAICAASVGSFATLVADGTNWYIMAGA
jgi:hypothetical protein